MYAILLVSRPHKFYIVLWYCLHCRRSLWALQITSGSRLVSLTRVTFGRQCFSTPFRQHSCREHNEEYWASISYRLQSPHPICVYSTCLSWQPVSVGRLGTQIGKRKALRRKNQMVVASCRTSMPFPCRIRVYSTCISWKRMSLGVLGPRMGRQEL